MAGEIKKLDAKAIEARNRLFHEALAAEKKEDFKKALECYRMSLQIDIKFFDSWLNAGALYSKQGKNAKAIECYQRALEDREDKRALYNLASEYFKIGKYNETKKLLSKALKQDRQFLQAHLLLGYTCGKTGEIDQAEQSIKSALKIDPDSRPAMTALALLYFHTDNRPKAIQYIDKLLAKSPDDIVIQRLKASLLLDSGDVQASVKAMKQIASRDTRLKSFYSSLREQVAPEVQQAIQQKRKKLEEKKDTSERDMVDLSLLAFFEGDPDKAMEYLLKATTKP